MNRDRSEEQLSELDRELAQMAQDVPDMPADFHARWTEQIRAEAGQAKTESRKENRKQLRYVLSAAAVFILLIGGTLLTRDAWNRNDLNNTVSGHAAVTQEAAAPAEDTEEVLYARKASNALPAEGGAAETYGNAVYADTAAEADASYMTEAAEEETVREEPAALMMPAATSMPEPAPKEAFNAAPAAGEVAPDTGAADAKDEPREKKGNLLVIFPCAAAAVFLAVLAVRVRKRRKK